MSGFPRSFFSNCVEDELSAIVQSVVCTAEERSLPRSAVEQVYRWDVAEAEGAIGLECCQGRSRLVQLWRSHTGCCSHRGMVCACTELRLERREKTTCPYVVRRRGAYRRIAGDGFAGRHRRPAQFAFCRRPSTGMGCQRTKCPDTPLLIGFENLVRRIALRPCLRAHTRSIFRKQASLSTQG